MTKQELHDAIETLNTELGDRARTAYDDDDLDTGDTFQEAIDALHDVQRSIGTRTSVRGLKVVRPRPYDGC